MPELPEVEYVTRALERLVSGRRIVAAKLLLRRLAPDISPQQFARSLRGARIKTLGRRGKHILIGLDNGRVLIVHLRMTGGFQYLPPRRHLPKYTHAIFTLDNGRRLVFTDQRQFGLMKIVDAEELSNAKELRSLAPEPFSAEFTPAYLAQTLSRSRRTLKELLLDQKRVVGLGNIYASEAMFLARINPFVKANELSRRRVPRLHRAILDVLNESISFGSSVDLDPENIDGRTYDGPFEERWRVYDREGEPCRVCGSAIRRVAQGGRSTFYCPRCQRR